MAYSKIRKGKAFNRCELTYTATVGTDTDVDVMELTPDGTRISLTRELPDWGDKMIVGFRVALEASAASNFTGEFGAGFCTSYAKRYGQTATEYALMAGIPATRTATYTNYYDATNHVPGATYYYYRAPTSLWNANSSTVSFSTNYISLVTEGGYYKAGVGTAAEQFASYNYAPMAVYMERTGANQILFGFRMVAYPHVCVPRENFRSGVTDGHVLSPYDNMLWAWNEVALNLVSVSANYGVDNTFTVDESTHGKFQHFNLVFNHASARLFVRDFICVHGGRIYPL